MQTSELSPHEEHELEVALEVSIACQAEEPITYDDLERAFRDRWREGRAYKTVCGARRPDNCDYCVEPVGHDSDHCGRPDSAGVYLAWPREASA